jgi:hypothetical protein
MSFELIPAAELAVDRPDFKASIWKPTTIRGEAWEISQCFEWTGGKWEGFVSIRRARMSKRRSLPKTITNLLHA